MRYRMQVAVILLTLLLAFLHVDHDHCNGQQVNDNHSLSQGDCPLWFHYNTTLHSCQCSTRRWLPCNGENAVMVRSDFIATYDKNRKLITVSKNKCGLFNTTGNSRSYITLPSNLSELNEYMCGPLNRKGYLCKDCVQGYGVTINTIGCTNKCYTCAPRDSVRRIILYLIVEFVPPTLLYTLILTFRISFTSAPMTCFILYSQAIVLIFYYSWGEELLHEIFYTEKGELTTVSKFILTLYGTFNLDFFRHVLPPLCITTHLKPIHRDLLGYISAFYPFVLIFITWFCIKLHDNNCKPVVIIWKPFHRCFVRLRKGWNIRNDLIDVFASFFLLSYSKVMYQTWLMLAATRNFHYSVTEGNLSETYVLELDSTIPTNSSTYITIASFAILILSVFSLIPLLIITLYPWKFFIRLLSKCRLDGYALTIFAEKFHSCYRDGLDGGKDMRSFSGLYFLLRILEVIVGFLPYFQSWFARGTLFSTVAVVTALCRPYKKPYMNIFDTLLLSHMAVLCHILSSQTENIVIVPFLQTLVIIPFAVFATTVIFKIGRELYFSRLKINSLFLRRLKVRSHDYDGAQRELNQSVITYGAAAS